MVTNSGHHGQYNSGHFLTLGRHGPETVQLSRQRLGDREEVRNGDQIMYKFYRISGRICTKSGHSSNISIYVSGKKRRSKRFWKKNGKPENSKPDLSPTTAKAPKVESVTRFSEFCYQI